MTINKLHRKMFVGVVIALSFGNAAFAEGPDPDGRLRRAISGLPETFTMEVELTLPAILLLPGQGLATQTVRLTAGPELTAIHWKTVSLPDPKYFPVGANGYEPIDYDPEGNLILGMPWEGATFRNPGIHEDYVEYVALLVSSDGTSRRAGEPSALLNRYSPSNSNTFGLATVRTIRWALGRPTPDALTEVTTDLVRADGRRSLAIVGQHGPLMQGTWDVVIDSGPDNLVRQARLAVENQEPRFSYSSVGTRWFGNIAIAERGEYVHHFPPTQETRVRLLSFKPELDQALVAEARQTIARSSTHPVRLADYRENPNYPTVRTVEAGDLDKNE